MSAPANKQQIVRWLHIRYSTVRVTNSGDVYVASNAYESAHLLGSLADVQEWYDEARTKQIVRAPK